jgi:glycerol-3-phosphate dehydrogenase
MAKQLESDVVVIGGGVTGSAIARELSRYKLRTVLVEKSEALCGYGQTKGSVGLLYSGMFKLVSIYMKSVFLSPGEPLYEHGSFTEKLEYDGFRIWHEEWLDQLDIEHRPLDCLMVATEDRMDALQKTWDLGQELGGKFAEMKWVDRDFILKKEPNVNPEVVSGLFNTSHQVTSTHPWELVFALLDNAQDNGLEVIRGAEVIGICRTGDAQIVETTKGAIKTRFIVNAAGAGADRVAAMGGAVDWKVNTQRGALFVLDKQRSAELVGEGENVITLPGNPGWMEWMYTTLDRNLLLNVGPYQPTKDRYMVEVTQADYELGLSIAKKLMPAISERDIIRSWSVARAYHTRSPEDHILEPCSTNPRFINAKVRLPGLVIAPAAAAYVLQLLGDAGLELTTKPDFNPKGKAIPRFRHLSDAERGKLIAQDSRYGHVVCRCETITEGEIVEAIKRGATTVQEVKYRTRSGMGRCQGGFCRPRVIQILARELGVPVTQVLEREAPVVFYKSKELLGREAPVSLDRGEELVGCY